VFTSIPVLRNWEIVGIIAVFVTPFLFYGAFIFRPGLKIYGNVDSEWRSIRFRAKTYLPRI
jgi:hypothetical protein